MSQNTNHQSCLTEGEIALALAVDNLALVPQTCMKHLHNWRKVYFNEKGIFKTDGIDWSKEYDVR